MNVLITGANRGIGLALTKQLAEKKHTLFACCREASDELREVPHITICDDIDIREFVLPKGISHIDLLINNAAIYHRDNTTSIEEMKEEFDVNALGALRVTLASLPFMEKGAKIALITSRMGSIGDNSSGQRYGYRMSKAALNMLGKSLSIDLKEKGIAVGIYHPGFVVTDMNSMRGDITAEECATRFLKRFEELNMENTGSFWHSDGSDLPW